MPNGADAPTAGIPSLEVKIPGVPAEATSFAALASTIGSFIGGLFGSGGGFRVVQTAAERDARIAAFRAGRDPDPIPGRGAGFATIPGTSIITGRVAIPTPAQGGPPLVTERFEDLPGPFVPEPEIPVLQELGIPFAEPEPLLFQPRPIPEPDILEEEMAVDAPLLSGFGSLLPAVRQVATPTVSGFVGGLAQDILSGLFARAPQELGAAQVPMRRAPAAMEERPSTRILRQIQASTGVRVKLSSAKSLIRQLGLQNGARCLGISITDACTLIITPSPRRRRGISGSDIRIVKRTARRFQSLQEDLSGLVSRRRAAPRRRARHVHAIQHTAPAP